MNGGHGRILSHLRHRSSPEANRRFAIREDSKVTGCFIETSELQLRVGDGGIARVRGEHVGVARPKYPAYRCAPAKVADDHEAPGLAQPDRWRAAGTIDEAFQCSWRGVDRFGNGERRAATRTIHGAVCRKSNRRLVTRYACKTLAPEVNEFLGARGYRPSSTLPSPLDHLTTPLAT